MSGTKNNTEGLVSLVCESAEISGSDILNSVEGISVEALQSGATCYVRASDVSYRFSDTSLATPALPDVILPAGQSISDPGRWILVVGGGGGSSSGLAAISNWRILSWDAAPDATIVGGAYVGGGLFATGATGGVLYTSETNGASWSGIVAANAIDSPCTAGAYDSDGNKVLYGRDSTNPAMFMYSTDNGVSWAEVTLPALTNFDNGAFCHWNGSVFAAISKFGTDLITAADPSGTWVKATNEPGNTLRAMGVDQISGDLGVTTVDNVFQVTKDLGGTAWETVALAGNVENLAGVAFDESLDAWVVVGQADFGGPGTIWVIDRETLTELYAPFSYKAVLSSGFSEVGVLPGGGYLVCRGNDSLFAFQITSQEVTFLENLELRVTTDADGNMWRKENGLVIRLQAPNKGFAHSGRA